MPHRYARHREQLRRLCGVLALLLASLGAHAQGWTGLSSSNYAGTNALYQNPSAIADAHYRVYVNLAGADVNFYNNYLKFDMPFSLWQLARNRVPARYSDGSGNPVFKDSYLQEQSLTGRTKYANLSAEVRLPSVTFGLPHGQAVAFSSRLRAMVQVNNVSESLARLSRYGLDDADRLGLANELLKDSRFSLNANAYHEFAGTYARVLTPNTTHFFKVGVTAKLLVGLGGGYINNQGLGYVVYNRDSIQLADRKVDYGYTDYKYYDRDKGFKIKNFYNKNRLGGGFGFDLGVTYEYRPDYAQAEYRMDGATRVDDTRPQYKLRLGLALVDLGSVRYNNQQYVSNSHLTPGGTVQLGSLDTLDYRNLQYVDYLTSTLAGVEKRTTRVRSKLPRTFNFTADYHLRDNYYVALVWRQNLLSKFAVGTRVFSNVAITPRFEKQKIEFALPLVLADDYRRLLVGAMLRVGPVFVGSDNLGSAFGMRSFSGFDVYAGVGFALFKHRPKDRDHDEVSDKVDRCVDNKGTWEFSGCPDRDGDHIEDTKDLCPDVPGVAEFSGCPDRDGDHVEDSKDLCPDDPGLVALQGCPDRDNDTVADKDDECPDLAGLPALKGCPDRDADGVADKDDKCPDLAGPADHAGCPDSDADSLYDHEDGCPTVAGPVENKGCPWPDADGDTVPDKDDECPQTPGPVENKGCPVLEKAEVKVLKTAFSNLEFEFRKDVIRKKSYPSLVQLATLLQEKPAFRLRLSGHTDNVGTPAFNMELSRKRAMAVKNFLVKRGVAADRIQTEAFGTTQPIAPNKTAAGRAKNRRVEMKVLFD